MNPVEQAYLRYVMALGMTKGTYPPIHYFGLQASNSVRSRQRSG